MLPYTAGVLFSFLEAYNRATGPAALFAPLLGASTLILVLRPGERTDRFVAAFLAVAFLWTGLVFHLLFFADLNFASPAYAALFVVQAALLSWTGVVRGRLRFSFQPTVRASVGLGLALYALLLYPLIDRLSGHGWWSVRAVGQAPDPTVLFTFGLLLLVAGRTPWHLLIIPTLWSLMAGFTAWWLALPQDAVLPIAAILVLVLSLTRTFSREPRDRGGYGDAGARPGRGARAP